MMPRPYLGLVSGPGDGIGEPAGGTPDTLQLRLERLQLREPAASLADLRVTERLPTRGTGLVTVR